MKTIQKIDSANTIHPARKKQGGFVMTSELVLLTTVMVIGMTVGLVTMRDAVTAEMEDVAEAIGSLNQSYSFDGLRNAELTAEVTGSSFEDAIDTGAGDGAGFTFTASPANEGVSVNNGVGADLTAAGNQTAP
ncbi:hypothetical protein G8764_07995 [Pseudomaricurvus alcaniphilus]|uniref:hypothetical protein n=1 Tax=Pseudomaricurvus alcaniphilus TaxID=1166482 RepID=UPI001407D3AA|nr:hypothetical protein [Pseudomaricurvus alcaniphilus]NHN37227.1 hypothetical protein [Pseudomaricurvus alcaniphilus]